MGAGVWTMIDNTVTVHTVNGLPIQAGGVAFQRFWSNLTREIEGQRFMASKEVPLSVKAES